MATYRNAKKDRYGCFTPTLRKETNDKLEIYCKINNFNKTETVERLLNQALDDIFKRLKEE